MGIEDRVSEEVKQRVEGRIYWRSDELSQAEPDHDVAHHDSEPLLWNAVHGESESERPDSSSGDTLQHTRDDKGYMRPQRLAWARRKEGRTHLHRKPFP